MCSLLTSRYYWRETQGRALPRTAAAAGRDLGLAARGAGPAAGFSGPAAEPALQSLSDHAPSSASAHVAGSGGA